MKGPWYHGSPAKLTCLTKGSMVTPQFFQIVGDKNTTISRLRKLLFGSSSEKTDKVVGDTKGTKEPSAPDGDDASSDHVDPNDNATSDQESSSGHGRYGADDYPGADQVDVKHAALCVGDDCPECQQGTLYEKTPSVLVRFVGQAPLQATVYRMQKLRCPQNLHRRKGH